MALLDYDNRFIEDPTSPDEFSTLSTDYPLVLFPVRIETRYNAARGGLMVRIYPDEISADTHEKELTAPERAAAEAYWTAVWNKSAAERDAAEREAWRTLTARYPAPRAAWIVRATNPQNSPPAAPILSDPGARAQSWTRPALVRLLPQRWRVFLYRGDIMLYHAVSGPVVPDLALTLSPKIDGDSAVALTDKSPMQINKDAHWTLDFDAALAAGMALIVPIKDAPDFWAGFDALFVLGVRSADPKTQNQANLESLIDAHHYTRGMSFVAQGTPTNNTAQASSGYGRSDPGGAESFVVERGQDLATADGDGARLAKALGVAKTAFAHVQGANGREFQEASIMNQVLYPVTAGYWVDHFLYPDSRESNFPPLRDFFINNTFGRGPFSALRIGAVPYGILPIVSPSLFEDDTGGGSSGFFAMLASQIKRYWETLRSSGANSPRFNKDNQAEEALLNVLHMDGRPHELWHTLHTGLEKMTSSAKGSGASTFRPMPRPLPNDPQSLPAESWRRYTPFVAPGPFGDQDLLPWNFITWLRTAPLSHVLNLKMPVRGWTPALGTPTEVPESAREPVPESILFSMLRYAMVMLIGRHARRLAPNGTTGTEYVPSENVPAPNVYVDDESVWMAIETFLVTPGQTVLQYLESGNSSTFLQELGDLRINLQQLENLPMAKLELLLVESLSLCSYRVDAAITGLAQNRLMRMRDAQPLGCHIGSYGWVCGLRAHAPPKEVKTLAEGGTAEVQASSGGYVHAPSMTHAAAGAVLRNAHLSHGTDPGRYAINLASARVRAGLDMLDSVRNGQQLGAVLGYRFERALHELQIEKYIAPLRGLYPLATALTEVTDQPTEAIAARNVVDGIKLRQAYRANAIPFNTGGLPSSLAAAPQLKQALDRLDDALDATADLLTAESVFQLVRGNNSAAAASFDTVSRGVRPTDPEIARTVRGGQTLTHRVALVLGSPSVALPAGWPAAPTPRAAAEPLLDAWAGTLFGDPRNIRCRVSFRDLASAPQAPRQEVVVALADLQVRPLDVLWLCKTTAATPEDCELDRRVLVAAFGATSGTAAVITYEADASWDRRTVKSFAALLELARAMNAVVDAARPLRPEDIALPEKGHAPSAVQGRELGARANAAAAALATNRLGEALAAVRSTPVPSAAALATLVDELKKLALFGISAAYPAVQPTALSELVAAAESTQTEAARRLAAAGAAIDLDNTDQATAAQRAQERLEAIFGRGFVGLYRFVPAAPADLSMALTGPRFADAKEKVVRKWLQQTAPVRKGLSRLRNLMLRSEALGAARSTPDIAQLPYRPDESWVGAGPVLESAAGKVSVVLYQVARPAVDGAWAGLFIDEWTEVVPAASQSTGLAIHFDNPGAEAPQAVLLAVPPKRGSSQPCWDLRSALYTLYETLDLVKIRAGGDTLNRTWYTMPSNQAEVTLYSQMLVSRFI